ncbi:glucuronate isomerase [Paenibacillus sp. SYP-B3998]|uniref:Uronate isomerase n=1 Tax=Paenibacillus sp. SYP-B3998 TaxID=2678564 RepID=A0A6G4A1J3_9BACL|nr:glucuronate isomerase [Paenibacillus sp. SYP-B3998]NEW07691.1 glucuronate isomerase [Paenibacillus sp. SYP-B3998]
MKTFLDENFLLTNDTAVRLFHGIAKDLPIIDYHCHLSPKEIYENKQFNTITEAWLYGDHYKWRMMRANGVEEINVTGAASDYDRFAAWASTLPMAIGNPLYHWSHMELQTYFDVHEVINAKNAPVIWDKVNTKLAQGDLRARDLITKSKVTVICTTDDPVDSLEYHIKIKDIEGFDTQVLPSFRPDKALEINRATFLPWIGQLEQASGLTIRGYEDLLTALESRANFFDSVGCKVSDHALDYVPFAVTTKEEVELIFQSALQGNAVSLDEEKKYKTYTLLFLGGIYNKLDWAMQYHINASRNNNGKMFGVLGPDTGYDSMNDSPVASALTGLLSSLALGDALPRTILYSLNPRDNDILGTLMGSFQGDGIAGKIQLGAAWWFNDTRDGMIQQMKTLANLGLLGRFVGMLTDSRSFLSYTRHEYFRRILCNLFGEWVEAGEFPNDEELLEQLVEGISYNNARAYFKF